MTMEDLEDINVYEVLGVCKDASDRDIKKAYHKMCLKYHPDKTNGFRVEFDRIQIAYLVLNDKKRRKLFDDTGKVCPWGPVSDSEAWSKHINDQFEKITKDLIEKDKKQYQGSMEERRDVLAAFIEFEGEVERLFENIIHLEFSPEQEKRIVELCESLIQDGEVELKQIPEWEHYLKNRKVSINKLKRKAEKEAQLVKDFAKEREDLSTLQSLIAKNSVKHRGAFSDIFTKYEEKAALDAQKKEHGEEEEDDEDEYGKDEDEEDDEEDNDYSEAEEVNDDDDDDDGDGDEEEEEEKEEPAPAPKKRKTK